VPDSRIPINYSRGRQEAKKKRKEKSQAKRGAKRLRMEGRNKKLISIKGKALTLSKKQRTGERGLRQRGGKTLA